MFTQTIEQKVFNKKTQAEIASATGLPREDGLRLHTDPGARNDVVGADPFLS
jgi:hypothetical protein